MNVLLNSRILIGSNHGAAERVARRWKSDLGIDWMQSPSDLCVLRFDTGDLPSGYGSTSGHGLRLANDLELELRIGLNLPPMGLGR